MTKRNSLIAAHIFVIFCATTLPSLSLYCRQGAQPVETNQIAPTPSPAEAKEEDLEKEEKTATKQMDPASPPPSVWRVIYNLLPQIIIQSFSTGSDAGVGAFTKTLTKQLLERKQILATKKPLEEKLLLWSSEQKKNDLLEETKNYYLEQYNVEALTDSQLTKVDKYAIKTIQQKITETDMAIKGIELKTSPSFIVGSAASTALIYTISAMTGALIKTGIGIAVKIMLSKTS